MSQKIPPNWISSRSYPDGSGYKQQTAWAGVGIGVLFYDASGKGQLTEANQFIFTDWDPSATTDLQALENVFDSNHDGQLDASDADYGDFFVMVTNADGSRTAHSLSSLDISAIGLTSNAYASGLPDGSDISGETSYTITTTTQTQGRSAGGIETTTTIMENAVASVTLATGGADYAVTTTTTTNADGSTTIDNVANNPDGSLAYSRLQNTAISGGTTTKTLSDISAGGVVTSLETVTTTLAIISAEARWWMFSTDANSRL